MVLLVIDVQKGITDERLYNYQEFIDNTTRLIQTARENDVEVIYVQHDDGPGSGFSAGDEDYEIADQVAPIGNERFFTKTVKSAFDRDYKVIVPAGCNSTFDNDYMNA